MTASATPSRARASRSAQPVKRKGSRIDDTFGQTSLESSESEDLSWRLANRYRLQTASLGSTLFDLTWKARRTPSGQLIFAQRARARRTSEIALSSRPTPSAQDGPKGGPEQGADRLPGAVALSSWATPTVRDHKDGESEGTAPANALLGRQVWLAGWQTPKLPSGGGQENRETPGGGLRKLEDQAILAGWPTPKVESGDYQYGNADHTQINWNLAGAVKLTSHPAPSTDSGGTQVGYYADLNGVVEIPVGGPLSAAHSRWLQGLPDVWDVCAATATALSRPLRRSSLKRT